MKYLLMLITCLSMCGCGLAQPEGKVLVEVVDEQGQRLGGATIAVSFGDGEKQSGTSSSNELFVASGRSGQPYVTIVVEKDGYYKSGQTYMFKNRDTTLMRYKPWEWVLTLQLREIKDPQRGKSFSTGKLGKIPKLDETLGFDALIGDWVSPWGRGVSSDMVFTCSIDPASKIASYILTFPNKGDGIIPYEFAEPTAISLYKWPFKATESGYESTIKRKSTLSDGDASAMPDFVEMPREFSDINYIFRIRTEYDSEGNIESAYYGKIKGDIRIRHSNKLLFNCWVNDDPQSRSLESTQPTSP